LCPFNGGGIAALSHLQHEHVKEKKTFTASLTEKVCPAFEVSFIVKERTSSILIPVQHKKQLTSSH
jgi:hypothetical protein